MKKLTAILFFSVFSFSTTELGQFLKLPVLLHHYLAHKQEEGSRSFASFLENHYGNENSHPSPNNEHENLPFKSHASEFSQITIVLSTSLEIRINNVSDHKQNSIYQDPFYSFSSCNRIWQPPRLS